ncbi:hypothetical protein D3C80_18000 [compost metagenome]
MVGFVQDLNMTNPNICRRHQVDAQERRIVRLFLLVLRTRASSFFFSPQIKGDTRPPIVRMLSAILSNN